jgi:hypothetical protein
MPGMGAGGGIGLLWLVYVPPLVTTTLGYLGAVRLIHRRGDRWPARRTMSWCAGLLAAAIAETGAGHDDFTAHMTGHLLLGMAAQVLVLAAPSPSASEPFPWPRPGTCPASSGRGRCGSSPIRSPRPSSTLIVEQQRQEFSNTRTGNSKRTALEPWRFSVTPGT